MTPNSEYLSYREHDKDVTKGKCERRLAGRFNDKAEVLLKELARKMLKFTKEVVAVQKHRNEILQAQHELGLFT